MVIFPNAKINLGLHISSKRPDGFHNIETVMVPVPWTDALEVVPRQDSLSLNAELLSEVSVGKVRMFFSGNNIPGNAEQNLCIRVFQALEQWYEMPETDVYLIKNIPTGAGLGGGSADAAACLRALKEVYDLRISDDEAKNLLAELGSDCPFFWDNRPAFAYGRGEKLRKINLDLCGKWIALIYPSLAISTAEAYGGVTPKQPELDLQLLHDLPVETWREVLVNDFETSLFPKFPMLQELKDGLYAAGAEYASLSGSGSTVFGIFQDPPSLEAKWLRHHKVKVAKW